MTYIANGLNQYHRTETAEPKTGQGYRHDEDGNLIELYVAADMNCDGVADYDDVDCFVAAIGNCPPNPDPYACDPCPCLNGDINGDGYVTFEDLDPFIAMLGAVGVQAEYAWDAENRLIQVAPPAGTEQEGDKKVEFAYDYVGRRVQKKVSTWDDVGQEWDLTLHRKSVWSGWLMLLELEGGTGVPPVDTILRKYTWGLDLAGQNGGAASGSAGALTDASGALADRFMMLRLVESRGAFKTSTRGVDQRHRRLRELRQRSV